MKKRTVRSAYGPKKPVRVKFPKRTPTKQSFKDECDINNIMAKYQKTGALAHANRQTPQYGFASPHDFAESMRIVTEAQEMFADLPSSLRNKFANSPENYLAFVQDPANAKEMAELGLLTKEAAQRLSEPPKAPEQPAAEPPQMIPPGGAPPHEDHPANE